MSKFVVGNLNQYFNNLQNTSLNRRTINSGFMPSSIVDKQDLPEPIQRKMKRTASTTFFNTGLNALNVKLANPTFYHPLFQPVNMLLPRDRRERNEWCRHFYRTEPIIATAIDLHTEYPVSEFNNDCPDLNIKKFFDYLAFEKLDIINLLLGIGHEYWKIGDVFIFGTLNESEAIWEKFTILNPDYINIRTSVFADDSIIELIPDDMISEIVREGPRGENAELYNQMPDEVIRSVKMNRNIKLDNRLITHIAHKSSDYESWGTPLMMRCFKALIYKDKLRAAQDAIANRHIFPIRLAKLGTPGEPYPTDDDLSKFRDLLIMADDDPYNFIIYHYGVQMDYVGSSGKILPLNTEFDFVQRELMAGLNINEAMINGQGPGGQGDVGNALGKRYMSYRYKLEKFILNKIYKPIAEMQGFFKPSPELKTSHAHLSDKKKRILAHKGEMELILPHIRWSQQNLTSDQSAVTLLQNLQGKKLVSTRTVLNIIGLNPEVEKTNLEQERGTVFDPDAPKTGPLPGMAGYKENQAQQEGGGGGGEEGMPALPDFASSTNNMVKLGSDEDINDDSNVKTANIELNPIEENNIIKDNINTNNSSSSSSNSNIDNINAEIKKVKPIDKRTTVTKLSSFFQPRATSSLNQEHMDRNMKFLPGQINIIKNV